MILANQSTIIRNLKINIMGKSNGEMEMFSLLISDFDEGKVT